MRAAVARRPYGLGGGGSLSSSGGGGRGRGCGTIAGCVLALLAVALSAFAALNYAAMERARCATRMAKLEAVRGGEGWGWEETGWVAA